MLEGVNEGVGWVYIGRPVHQHALARYNNFLELYGYSHQVEIHTDTSVIKKCDPVICKLWSG